MIRLPLRLFWAALLCLAALAPFSAGAEVRTVHALAMHGEPKYGPDFRHFDYVNPEAPKGGTIRLGVTGTFDSFNPYIARGNPAAGVGYETLLVSSADEPFTEYGLIAESITVPDDRSWVVFTLRPEARWHDGAPITADDVIFSLNMLKEKGNPFFRFYYGNIVAAERLGERQVRFVFAEQDNRELPLIAGQIPILPKHYWESRDFERTTLEPPLLSGPYRVAAFEAGRYVTLERVEDYWGRDLPVNVGQSNFGRIRYDYFRDDTVVRQALKSGTIDFREENQAKAWALDYDVPVVRNGWLVKEEVPHERPTGMQGFVMNLRRPVFQDPVVRRALAYAFDFEWSNRTLFFGQYTRTESYFSNSELAATGLPAGEELAILQRYRGRLPEELFTTPYRAPRTDGSGWPRENLATAFRLLESAGWVVRDMALVNAETGRQMRFEILLVSPAFERIVLPYVRNLRRLGIDARVRLVDESQYINRIRAFDYDMFVVTWGQSESPGNEQRSYWSSEAADSPGASNYAGLQDPVVDALIELVIQAPDRESLVQRTRALDRVLLWHHLVVPHWHSRMQRILYWDKFSRPAVTTKYGTAIDYWWFDSEKAQRLEERRRAAPEIAAGEGGGSGPGVALPLAIAAAVGLAGFFLLRAALRRRPA